MRKIILKAALIVSVLAAGSANADAQYSNFLSKLVSGTSKNSTSNSDGILGTIGTMFSSKLVPSQSQIIGTWVYQRPAVVLTSKNALTTSAGSLVSNKIETTLQGYLAKAGITKGKSSVTFNADSTFTFNYGTRKVSGTYTISNNKVSLTFKGMKQVAKLTPQLNNGALIVAADATAIKTFMQDIGSTSGVAAANTISTILQQFDGMMIGMRLTKQ